MAILCFVSLHVVSILALFLIYCVTIFGLGSWFHSNRRNNFLNRVRQLGAFNKCLMYGFDVSFLLTGESGNLISDHYYYHLTSAIIVSLFKLLELSPPSGVRGSNFNLFC